MYLNSFSTKSFANILGVSGSVNKLSKIEESYLKWANDTFDLFGNTINTQVIQYTKIKRKSTSKKTTYEAKTDNEAYNYLIYNKLPERLLYGLMKYDSSVSKLKASIYLDSNHLYTLYDTKFFLKNQLNAQAKYRSHNYIVDDVRVIYKTYDHSQRVKTSELDIQLFERLFDAFKSEISKVGKKAKRLQMESLTYIMKELNEEIKPDTNNVDDLYYQLAFGISMIDLILGCVRTILIINDKEIRLKDGKDLSNRKFILTGQLYKRGSFVVQLLKNKCFRELLSECDIFDVILGEHMTKVNFSKAISLFEKKWELIKNAS
jgi:hypothetical protein